MEISYIYEDEWAEAEEVQLPPEPLPPRECQGLNCLNMFTPTWHTQKRCDRCRQEKRPYKDAQALF